MIHVLMVRNMNLLWEIGRCNDYDVEVANQMSKTIALLRDKVDLLNKIRQENDVSFYLEIVPTLDVIDFCHSTRTELDIDLYIIDSSDELCEDN